MTDPAGQAPYVPLSRAPVLTVFGWASIGAGAFMLWRILQGVAHLLVMLARHNASHGAMFFPLVTGVLPRVIGWGLVLGGGVLLLRRRRLGRGLSIAGALVLLLFAAFLVFAAALANNMGHLARVFSHQGMGVPMLSLALALFASLILSVFYPLALLVAMCLPSTARALRRPVRCPEDTGECSPMACELYYRCERVGHAREEPAQEGAGGWKSD